MKFCSLKIERYFGFPHDSNYRATKRKVCFGPWTDLGHREPVLLKNRSANHWDFFADMVVGRGLQLCLG